MCRIGLRQQRTAEPRRWLTTNSATFNFRRYQYHGSYLWPVVRSRHEANLRMVLDDLPGWQTMMIAEVQRPRFADQWVRIHDAGDFFSDDYLRAWIRICRACPDTHFYCYTKEVDRFRRLVEPNPPGNLHWVYSYGGTQDPTLHPGVDRVADVFPDEESIDRAGWSSQRASDLLAVLGPPLVGMSASRIPAFLKRMAGRRFSTWQAATHRAPHTRPPSPAVGGQAAFRPVPASRQTRLPQEPTGGRTPPAPRRKDVG
nr:hypothetical protein [Actinoplanes humidus]